MFSPVALLLHASIFLICYHGYSEIIINGQFNFCTVRLCTHAFWSTTMTVKRATRWLIWFNSNKTKNRNLKTKSRLLYRSIIMWLSGRSLEIFPRLGPNGEFPLQGVHFNPVKRDYSKILQPYVAQPGACLDLYYTPLDERIETCKPYIPTHCFPEISVFLTKPLDPRQKRRLYLLPPCYYRPPISNNEPIQVEQECKYVTSMFLGA